MTPPPPARIPLPLKHAAALTKPLPHFELLDFWSQVSSIILGQMRFSRKQSKSEHLICKSAQLTRSASAKTSHRTVALLRLKHPIEDSECSDLLCFDLGRGNDLQKIAYALPCAFLLFSFLSWVFLTPRTTATLYTGSRKKRTLAKSEN